MKNDKSMPIKYWLYVLGLFTLFFAFSYIAYMPEEVGISILMSVLMAVLITSWLIVVHLLWFADGLLYKILALVIGGLFAVLIVILIQFIYESLVLKKVKGNSH